MKVPFCLVLLTVFSVYLANCSPSCLTNLPTNGVDSSNSRSMKSNINACNVANLTVEWSRNFHADISATPIIWKNALFITTFSGEIAKLNALTGEVLWSRNMSIFTNIPGSFARASPVISKNDELVVGDQVSGTLVCLRSTDGGLIWTSLLDPHPAAILTISPVIDEDRIYIGVSSQESTIAAFIPNYPCCSFSGSAVAVNLTNGQILWQTRTIPVELTGPGKYSGAAVWGSSSSFDDKRVCFGTGNPYTVPDNVTACEYVRANSSRPDLMPSCLDERVIFDSMMCLDKLTGDILWYKRTEKYDAWTVGCMLPELGIPDIVNCPTIVGPDADFPEAPIMTASSVIAGQKSGALWSRNKNTGRLNWGKVVGPGGTLGGFMWGSAYEARNPVNGILYSTISNSQKKNITLLDGTQTDGAFFFALDTSNGKVLWQTAEPDRQRLPAPVSVTNGVVFGGSMTGKVYALDGETGKILWSFQSGATVNAGIAISDDWIFFGNGYTKQFGGPHTGLFALKLRK